MSRKSAFRTLLQGSSAAADSAIPSWSSKSFFSSLRTAAAAGGGGIASGISTDHPLPHYSSSLLTAQIYPRYGLGMIPVRRALLASITGHGCRGLVGHAGSTRSFASKSTSGRDARRRDDASKNELVVDDEEEFSAITDKIPQRPMSVVEGTSYSLVILAALGFAAAVLYAAFSELLFSPKEYTCYSKALARIEDDPRVTIRLGSPIHAYGTESRNRSARQRIPHRIYNDADGVEHVQLQFHAKGPSGRAIVHADMYKEDGGEYKYHYLYLTVESPLPQQVVLIRPHQPDNE